MRRHKVYPDRPIVHAQNVPEGWEKHSAAGCVAPLSGVYKGIPMRPDSALAIALGYPGKPNDGLKPAKYCLEDRCFIYMPHTHCDNCKLIYLHSKTLCPKCGHAGMPIDPDRQLTPAPMAAVIDKRCTRCRHTRSQHYDAGEGSPMPCGQCSCFEFREEQDGKTEKADSAQLSVSQRSQQTASSQRSAKGRAT